MKAIIIGGGIGGVSAALALERVGIRCDVYEQAEELREVGTGLTVWANALRALSQLGATRRVLSLASKVDHAEGRTSSGQVVSRTSFLSLEERLGVPACVVIHRADLLRELASGLEMGRTHCAARCISIEDRADEVIARFADGREERADLLVGADGLHSVVRTQLHGPSKTRYAGYVCWRGVAPLGGTGPPPGLGFESWGPGARFAVHHCGPGRLFWYATRNLPEGGGDSGAGRKADVLDIFRRWHGPIPEVIEATSSTEILRNDIVDRVPLMSWGRGRVTLLGDAAHPTTPNLGQGACQALEDAVFLAASLARHRDVESGLRHYEQARQARTASITRHSWRLGKLFQWENPLGCRLRNTLIRWSPNAASLRWIANIVDYDLPSLHGSRVSEKPDV